MAAGVCVALREPTVRTALCCKDLYIPPLQSSSLSHLYFLHRLLLEQTLRSLVGDFLPKLIYIS